jgi:hypothetical protein
MSSASEVPNGAAIDNGNAVTCRFSVSEGRLHPRPNACYQVSSPLGAGHNRFGGHHHLAAPLGFFGTADGTEHQPPAAHGRLDRPDPGRRGHVGLDCPERARLAVGNAAEVPAAILYATLGAPAGLM